MFLMPGVQSVGRWGNVMGGQDFTTDMYVEGIPITNAVVQGEGRKCSSGLSVEAVDQFQVETSGTAVTFNGQGASNYVVKSGTNTFRGSGFEYFRHKALDAKAFFAAIKPDDNQHEYGGTLGGPIRRNQMFFFMAYDGYRDRRQTPAVLTSIPTLAERTATSARCRCRSTIRGRRDRIRAAPGSSAIRSRATSSRPIASRPSHNISSRSCPIPTNAGLQSNYLGGALPIGFNNNNVTGKVDLKLSARQQLSVLFSYGKRSAGDGVPRRQPSTNPQTALPLPYTETRLVEEVPMSAQIKHTYVLGSRWVNQASFGFARLSVPIFSATLDGQFPIKAGLRGLPAGEADSSFPEIAFLGPNAPTAFGRAYMRSMYAMSCGQSIQQPHFVRPIERVREHEVSNRDTVAGDERASLHVLLATSAIARKSWLASGMSAASRCASGYRFMFLAMRHSGCSSSVTVNSNHLLTSARPRGSVGRNLRYFSAR